MIDQGALLVPYAALVAPQGGVQAGGGVGAFRSGLLDHVTPAAAEVLAGLVGSGEVPMLQIRPVGGAVNDVDPRATAFPAGRRTSALNAVGLDMDSLNARWDAAVAPHTNGLYLSFEGDTRPERLENAFPGETLERLRRLKAIYDPDQVFDQNFPIPPAAYAPAASASP